MNSRMITLLFNFYMLMVVCGSLVLGIRLQKKKHRILSIMVLGGMIPAVGLLTAIVVPVDIFFKIQMLTWALLLHMPLYFVSVSILLIIRKSRWAFGLLILSLVICAITVDAICVEPRWLEVTHYTISSNKLTEPICIAVLADIQTDAPGSFEKYVLQMTKKADPDLILLAGDYLQISNTGDYRQASRTLNQLFKQADLHPPLGIFAIQGNIDQGRPWQKIFEDLPVDTFFLTRSTDLGPLMLTGLSMEDSFDKTLSVPKQDKFQILLGHCPNFCLGENKADLLIAGHTHGGQVRIPLLGPLLTFSAIPRSWTAGKTRIAPGKTLIVSRGLGMERHTAPRLRFLCRPELVIVNVDPE